MKKIEQFVKLLSERTRGRYQLIPLKKGKITVWHLMINGHYRYRHEDRGGTIQAVPVFYTDAEVKAFATGFRCAQDFYATRDF